MRPSEQPLPDLFADVAQLFGLSRPAGQCFAAIWRAASAPCADDLVATLGLSRSNVSTALKELRGWNLIGLARAPGDRKDYFTAPIDPWDIFGRLMAARQRQVVAPILDRIVAAVPRLFPRRRRFPDGAPLANALKFMRNPFDG